MVQKGSPARRAYTSLRWRLRIVAALFVVMTLSARHASADSLDKTGRAAEYVRMSTDHQQYSTQNQRDAIRRFADARGFTIVRSYIHSGKSGVGIQSRDALQRLL